MSAFIPYCGTAPIPGSEHWNLDPVLLGILFAAAAAFGSVAWSGKRIKRSHSLLFAGGWAVVSLAFVSPLCNVSVALFSARVAQHMVLSLLAAPLIAAGLSPLLPPRTSASALWGSCTSFAFVLWFWHSPLPYDDTLHDNRVYWLMHVSTVLAAIMLWVAVFSSTGLTAFLALSITGMQMSLLGALLTFARSPLFLVHEFTTTPWGLSWLQDQQLGGLIMWIPAGLLLTVYSITSFGVFLRSMDGGAGEIQKPI